MEKCKAKLHIADDYGDNHATMKCQLNKDHTGVHIENYHNSDAGTVCVTWEKDQKDYFDFEEEEEE